MIRTEISDEVLSKARHMHLSSVFLQPGLKPGLVDLFKSAKSMGLTTSLDPQWDPAEKWDIDLRTLLPYVDIFLPNKVEIMSLASVSSIKSAIEHVRSFSNVVVVKDGTNGAVMWDKTKVIEKPARINDRVVDSIGAGDSFNAGFINSFLKRKSLEDCLDIATVTGAINTTAAGGTGAFTTLEKVKEIAKQRFNYRIE